MKKDSMFVHIGKLPRRAVESVGLSWAFVGYGALLYMINWLDLSMPMQIISLCLGTLLLLDVMHKSLYVRANSGS